MIHFQTSTPWSAIKGFHSKYFSWLRNHKVYLNLTKFKTDTLVPCGFLVGAHPGFLRRNEAKEELRGSLSIDPEELPFQLSARTISVPLKEGEPGRFSFQAVVVETAVKHATKLRDFFYMQDNPATAVKTYPYTGMNQFVPLLKSTEWTVQKIFLLAQLHVKIIDDLKKIYVHNLKDLNNVINANNEALLQSFYELKMSGTYVHPIRHVASDQLIHSIHNTGKPHVKVVLGQSSKYNEALGQLELIHTTLLNKIDPQYHKNVFLDGVQPGMR
jgi:hypothetical protein